MWNSYQFPVFLLSASSSLSVQEVKHHPFKSGGDPSASNFQNSFKWVLGLKVLPSVEKDDSHGNQNMDITGSLHAAFSQ